MIADNPDSSAGGPPRGPGPTDPGVTSFRTAAKRFKVGLDVAEDVVVPAHEGLTAMQVAGPVEDSG